MSEKEKSTLAVSQTSKVVRPKSALNPHGERRGERRSSYSRKDKSEEPYPWQDKSEMSCTRKDKSEIKSASSGYSSTRSLNVKTNEKYPNYYEESSDESDSDDSGILGDNTRHWHSHPDANPQKVSAMKKYKMEVMRKILAEFNLEETLDYYSNMSLTNKTDSFKFSTKDFSPECSYQAELLRRRMVLLMGTDEVNTNDRKYNDAVRQNLWQEYEAELDRAEKDRCEMERKRMHRLMKNGVITYDELKGDPIFIEEWHKTKLKYGRTNPKRKSSPRSKSKRAQTAPPSDTKQSAITSSGTLLQTKPSQNPPPGSARKQPERPRTVQWESRHEKSRYKEENTDDADLEGIDCTRWGSYDKYQDPWILKMQDEESVGGLYAIAEDLLEGKLPSQMGKTDTKKKTTTS